MVQSVIAMARSASRSRALSFSVALFELAAGGEDVAAAAACAPARRNRR